MGKKKVLIPIAAFVLLNVASALYLMPFPVKGKKNKRRVLCIGDSITYGAGVVFTRWKDSYPVMLNKLLGDSYHVLNYGISGATAQEGTNQPYNAKMRKLAARTNPEVCLYMLGTNDSKPYNWNAERYDAAVREWIHELQEYPSRPRVVVMTPPAAFSLDGKQVVYDIREEVIRDEIRPALLKIAEEEGVELLDLYEATKDHPEWFGDGVHPNAKGDQAIAEVMYEKIRFG